MLLTIILSLSIAFFCLIYASYLHLREQPKRRTRKEIEVEKFYERMGLLGYSDAEIDILIHEHKSLADLIEVNRKMKVLLPVIFLFLQLIPILN